MTIYTAVITLILIMDPIGNVPMFISLLRHVPESRRYYVLLRESLIALGIIIAFMFGGHYFLDALNLSSSALNVAGGLILFIIALRLIFPDNSQECPQTKSDPLVVPIATPMIAGPSTLAWVMLIGTHGIANVNHPVFVVCFAWTVSTIILFLGFSLSRFIGERGLIALERLMGMLLTIISVQMLLGGIAEFYHLSLA